MSEDSQQREHRERQTGGGWLIVIFVALPLLYVLSPPWVALLLGPNYLDYDWYLPFYSPLVYLSQQFEAVNDFYEWYFRVTGVV